VLLQTIQLLCTETLHQGQPSRYQQAAQKVVLACCCWRLAAAVFLVLLLQQQLRAGEKG
jgi:hypothetical protein